jgi:hypothetical protein
MAPSATWRKHVKKIILALLLAAGGAAIGVYVWQQNKMPPATSAVQTSPAADGLAADAPQQPGNAAPPQAILAAPEQAKHHPVAASIQAAPSTLPALDASDPTIQKALIALLGKVPVQQLLQRQEIVRRIVVTIDNLPRSKVAARLLPIKNAEGAFMTEGVPGNKTIAPENAARYSRYLYLADLTDTRELVDLYAHYYPLFQRAYQELGYPDGYFNDRLIAVIDHLLATPSASEPLALTQPHILQEFADPALQSRSAGQKILLRIGNANATRIKAKLREIRAVLIEKMPAQTPAPSN